MAISYFIITGGKEWETNKSYYEWEIIILKLQKQLRKDIIRERREYPDTMARIYFFVVVVV